MSLKIGGELALNIVPATLKQESFSVAGDLKKEESAENNGWRFHKLPSLWLVILVIILVLTGCGTDDEMGSEPIPAAATPNPPTIEEKITLGVISGEPSEEIERRQGFINFVAEDLAEQGITLGEVKVTPDMELMGEWLASGEVDFLMDSFFPAAIVSDIAGTSPVLYRQRDKDDKRSVFFANAEGGISSFDELPGHMIVLEEPDSTSGFLLPIFYLLEAGMTPVEKTSPTDSVESDEVGYVFSFDDDAVVQWVLAGQVMIGAAQDNNFEDFTEENPGTLVSLLETEPIIRDQPVVISPTASPELRNALVSLLIGLSDSDEGQAMLEELETARFTELPPERQSDADRAQEMFDRLNEEGYLPYVE